MILNKALFFINNKHISDFFDHKRRRTNKYNPFRNSIMLRAN